MKTVTLAVVAAALMLPANAGAQSRKPVHNSSVANPSAATDPLKLVYRISGIRDNGGSDSQGVTTAVICTNHSGVQEKFQFIVYSDAGTKLKQVSLTANSLQSRTVVTHGTSAYPADAILLTSSVIGGSMLISSSTTNMQCTAMALDASSLPPSGVALHAVRFNPHPGSQE